MLLFELFSIWFVVLILLIKFEYTLIVACILGLWDKIDVPFETTCCHRGC